MNQLIQVQTGNLQQSSTTQSMHGPKPRWLIPLTTGRVDRNNNDYFKQFLAFRNRTVGRLELGITEPVRVTIIDTGLDTTHPFIAQHQPPWMPVRKSPEGVADVPLFKDFAEESSEFLGGSHDTPQDKDGHGTFIAGLILQIAPDVELSVARIGITQRQMGRDSSISRKLQMVKLSASVPLCSSVAIITDYHCRL